MKRDPLISAGIISLILCFAFRIPLMAVIGAEGVAYFAPVNEVFLLCIAFCNNGFSEALGNMMKYRVKREQYKNARRIYIAARSIAVVFAIFVIVIIAAMNGYISNVIFLQPFSRMALIIISPAIILMIFTCLLRGYFQGMGSPFPSAHSMVIEQIFTIFLGILLAMYFIDYGEKVAAILRNDSFALSYGAMGAALGVSLAAIVSFLHLLFIYFMYLGTIKRQIYRDNTRQIETPGFLYQSLFLTAVPIGLLVVLSQIHRLIDQRMYYYYFNLLNINDDIELNKAEVWGNYYGIFLAVIGIIVVLLSLITVKAAKSITSAWLREEHRSAREQLSQVIVTALVWAVLLAVLTAVLAEPVIALIGQGSEASVKLLQSGSALIVLYAFSLLWLDLLKQLKRLIQMLIVIGGGLAVHIAVLLIFMPLVSDAERLISRVIAANLAGAGFMLCLGFYFVSRLLKFQGEYLNKLVRVLAITLLCSAITGLMAMLLNFAIHYLIGPAATLVICLLISITAYFILMMVLRGLSASELDKLPGGYILIKLGRLFRVY